MATGSDGVIPRARKSTIQRITRHVADGELVDGIAALAPRRHLASGTTWTSPFGALTVEYAAPLTKAAYDAVQPLHFSAEGF